MLTFLIRALVAIVIFAIVVILSQDLQVFPRAVMSLRLPNQRPPETVPADVTSTFLTTDDNQRIEVWQVKPIETKFKTPVAAILFHGNGDWVESFHHVQQWLASLGVESFSFDYRGYGYSSGWPSEEGIYRDSDAVYRFVHEEHGFAPERTFIFATSIGVAAGARLAAKHQLPLAVLVAPYTNLKLAASQQPLYGLLSRFLWTKFPTDIYVQSFTSTDLILAHGALDHLILPEHSALLEQMYRGSGNVKRILAPRAGHNDILGHVYDQLGGDISTRFD